MNIRQIRIKHISRLIEQSTPNSELKTTDCPFTFDAQIRRYQFHLKIKNLHLNRIKYQNQKSEVGQKGESTITA